MLYYYTNILFTFCYIKREGDIEGYKTKTFDFTIWRQTIRITKTAIELTSEKKAV